MSRVGWAIVFVCGLSAVFVSAQAKENYPPQGVMDAWSTDCDQLKRESGRKGGAQVYWFIMDERESSKPSSRQRPAIFIGNQIKTIALPGLHDVADVHNDPRIRWISRNEITVDNERWWKGRLTFYRCSWEQLNKRP